MLYHFNGLHGAFAVFYTRYSRVPTALYVHTRKQKKNGKRWCKKTSSPLYYKKKRKRSPRVFFVRVFFFRPLVVAHARVRRKMRDFLLRFLRAPHLQDPFFLLMTIANNSKDIFRLSLHFFFSLFVAVVFINVGRMFFRYDEFKITVGVEKLSNPDVRAV